MRAGDTWEAENSAVGGINCRATADRLERKAAVLLGSRDGTAFAHCSAWK
jgi:hypothetical protein